MGEEGEIDSDRRGSSGNVVKLAQYFSEPREIAAVVLELCEIDRKAGLDRSLAIGQLVLHRFFGGSAEVWRDRRRNKNNSVRRIAEHPDCPLSRSALNEAIGVYVTVRSLPSVQTSGHVTASHIAAVGQLPTENQREWLDRAEHEHWSVRQLKEHLRIGRLESGERRGRPRAAPEQRLVAGVRSAIGVLRRAVENLAQGRRGLDHKEELLRLADEVESIAEELRLGKRLVRSEPCASTDAIAKTPGLRALESAG